MPVKLISVSKSGLRCPELPNSVLGEFHYRITGELPGMFIAQQ